MDINFSNVVTSALPASKVNSRQLDISKLFFTALIAFETVLRSHPYWRASFEQLIFTLDLSFLLDIQVFDLF